MSTDKCGTGCRKWSNANWSGHENHSLSVTGTISHVWQISFAWKLTFVSANQRNSALLSARISASIQLTRSRVQLVLQSVAVWALFTFALKEKGILRQFENSLPYATTQRSSRHLYRREIERIEYDALVRVRRRHFSNNETLWNTIRYSFYGWKGLKHQNVCGSSNTITQVHRQFQSAS
jgi:hypothetical protein